MSVGKGNTRGIHYTLPNRKALSSDDVKDERALERWGPAGSEELCQVCGDPLSEKLLEFSILSTRRCRNGHRSVKLIS